MKYSILNRISCETIGCMPFYERQDCGGGAYIIKKPDKLESNKLSNSQRLLMDYANIIEDLEKGKNVVKELEHKKYKLEQEIMQDPKARKVFEELVNSKFKIK